MRSLIDSALNDASQALDALRRNSQVLDRIAEVARSPLVQTFNAGGKVIAAGNGGSMCDAMHLAEELAGRFRDDRRALPAIAISDPGLLSCVANDYGYERVFARFLEAHGRPGDLFVGISTSGTSPNVLAAASTARAIGMRTVALVGRPGSPLESGHGPGHRDSGRAVFRSHPGTARQGHSRADRAGRARDVCRASQLSVKLLHRPGPSSTSSRSPWSARAKRRMPARSVV